MKARLTSGIDTTFVLTQTIHLALGINVSLLHPYGERLERIYLLKHDKVALVAALDR